VRREDDAAETVRRRLATYAAVANPLIDHYKSRAPFISVDGLRSPDVVTAALIAQINGAIGKAP
jgi:adenylate kinase family enzyme